MVGALIAVSLFLWFHKPKTNASTLQRFNASTFFALTDMMAAIAPFGIMLGRIGNWLNRELYGPLVYNADMISSRMISGLWERSGDGVLLIKGSLYTTMQKLNLIFDYGTTQMYAGEMRLNTNFLASFGEGLLILIVLQTLFWTKRRYGKMRA
ncbi:MAG: prolipoprotein diacylglyceryl transferase [Candidatus Peribacteria bacterium]|nr:MAG: prolipoprotein diacylglyceryl transferase [Candidatus Peribacteria bacterium]